MTIAASLLSKVVVVTVIAALAEVVRRRTVRPEPAYAMWSTVLAVLLIPSVITSQVPRWVDAVTGFLSLRSLFGDSWVGVVAPLWIVGVGFVFWRQWHSLRLLEGLVRFAAVAPATVSNRCTEIADEMGIRNHPTVVTASGAFSPFLWHPLVGEARVVIPSELLSQFSDEAIDAVLRHELMHLRRRDAWRRYLEVLVLAIWWWLPTTWIARCRLRELEELCTDGAVLRANPEGAKAYARALLDTEEFLSRSRPGDLLVVSTFARRLSLKVRITRIVTDEPKALTRTSQVFVCGSVMMLLSLGLLTAGVAPSAFIQAVDQNDVGQTEPRLTMAEMSVKQAPVGVVVQFGKGVVFWKTHSNPKRERGSAFAPRSRFGLLFKSPNYTTTPVGDDDSVLERPDSESFTMHYSDKEHESCDENSAA